MSKLFGLTAVVAAACLVILVQPAKAAEDTKTIKEIMKAAHSAPKGEKHLRDKAVSKDATDADKKALLALYKDLAKTEPPKGDKEKWKTMTADMVTAATELSEGKQGAAAKVTKASNCTACHDFYREKPK